MAKVPYGVEKLRKISIVWVGRTNVTDDRQTTDGRTMTYSEHELEFTFAKNGVQLSFSCNCTYRHRFINERELKFMFAICHRRSVCRLYVNVTCWLWLSHWRLLHERRRCLFIVIMKTPIARWNADWWLSKSSEEREKIKDSVQCTVMCVLRFFIRLLCAIKTDHMRPAFSHHC